MKNFTPCVRCQKKPGPQPGYYYSKIIKNNHEYRIVKECNCHKIWSKKHTLYKNYINSGFQKNDFEYDISTYLGEKSKGNLIRLQNYLKNLSDSRVISSLLYFFGKNGTQKSTVAAWIGKSILELGYTCTYVIMNDLILNLHKSNMDEEIRENIQINRDCDVIIIDEAFTQKAQWGGYFDNFIKDRINKGKGIIFVSNINPNYILNNGYDNSVQDLINREILKRDSLFIFEDSYEDNKYAIPNILF
jgi:DNA replication protein DnaC